VEKHRQLKTALATVLSLVLVIGLSIVSTRLWGGKPEETPTQQKLVTDPQMTVGQFGQANNLPRPVLKEVFNLQSQSDLAKTLGQYGTAEQVAAMVTKKLALSAEHVSKNWIKISLKYLLWFVFLTTVFFWCKKRKITSRLRKALLLAAVPVKNAPRPARPPSWGRSCMATAARFRTASPATRAARTARPVPSVLPRSHAACPQRVISTEPRGNQINAGPPP